MSTGCYSQILITGRVYKTMFGVIKPFDSREQKSLCKILHLTGLHKNTRVLLPSYLRSAHSWWERRILTENNNGIINGYRVLILAYV